MSTASRLWQATAVYISCSHSEKRGKTIPYLSILKENQSCHKWEVWISLNCGNFHHFISGHAGGFLSVQAAWGNPSCRGRIGRIIELGWKGNVLFPGICQGRFSWFCTEETSNPKIIYTGRFDRNWKKASMDYDRDRPTLLNQTTGLQPCVFFFSNFCLHWTLDCQPFLGGSLLLGPLENFQGILWVKRDGLQEGVIPQGGPTLVPISTAA